MNKKDPRKEPQKIGSLLKKYKLEDKGGHISQEFQDFGYRMCMELSDERHKSLYMRLAKTVDRQLLERALSFVKDANAKSPAKLFMWKLKQLKLESAAVSKKKPKMSRSERSDKVEP